jgi:hypothetical protein
MSVRAASLEAAEGTGSRVRSPLAILRTSGAEWYIERKTTVGAPAQWSSDTMLTPSDSVLRELTLSL